MKNFFIQYGRYFLLAFVLGFMLPRFDGGNLQASSSQYDEYYKTYSGINTLDAMILEFHKNMNATTNDYIERLLASKDPNVLYPASDADCEKGSNLSTYCLAVVLNVRLWAFEAALADRKDTLEELKNTVQNSESAEDQEDEEAGSSDRPDTLDAAIQFANQQSLVVEEQMENAEDALDLTLAVYNQIQIVWPLHVELTDFRTNLEGFRDNLAKVRDVIEGYPGKFNGASTAQCK